MTDLERKACRLALRSIKDWLDSGLERPLADTLKEIDLALAVMEDRGWPDVTSILGNNWALTRRHDVANRITEKHYHEAQLAVYATRIGVSKAFVAARLA